MKELTFEMHSNEDIRKTLDKNAPYILLHKFMPYETIEWRNTHLTMRNGVTFDLEVRNLTMDIQTKLADLQKFVDLNTRQLRIYQFDRPIPDTLLLEYLPEDKKNYILQQNGFKHFIFCNNEYITISSVDKDYIEKLKNDLKVFPDQS